VGGLAEDGFDLEHDPGGALGEAAGAERGQEAVGRLVGDLGGDQPAQHRGQVTPLWLTARYSPSSQGRGPTIGRRSAGMARQASHHRSTGTPARTGKNRAAWPSRARAWRAPGSVTRVSWVRSPTSTDPSARWRRLTAGPGPLGR
jgi:hypothetical protein